MSRGSSYYHTAKAEGGERWQRVLAAREKSNRTRRERALTDPAAWLELHLRRTRSRCRREGIEFAVTADDITLPTHCPIMNMPINYASRGRDDFGPSLDRIMPWRGYIAGNVRILSRVANRYRQDCTSSGVFLALAHDAMELFGDR